MDLGANVGYTAAHFAHLFPAAQVYAVEMDAGNLRIAADSTAPWKDRCHLTQAAVWDSEGVITYGGNVGCGLRVNDLDAGAAPAPLQAPARTIAALFDGWGVSQVDYLKMDIEGAEQRVFDADLSWLARVNAIKIEIHPPAEMQTTRERLAAAGFDCTDDTSRSACLIAMRRTQ